MKTITFSIASYNVEKYLTKTLESFIDDELLNDIEVLIIDDGSKDNTAQIAISFEKKYPQTFRLVRKKNGGHGSTINKGIKEAKGKYFKVIDGDDWVDTKQTIKLVEYLKTTDIDLVLTHFKKVYTSSNYVEILVNHSNGMKLNKSTSFDYNPPCTIRMHQITIKTDILRNNNVTISENCFYVDAEFDIYCIANSNTLIYLDLCIYMYRLGREGQSISLKSSQKNFEMHKFVSLKIVDYYHYYTNNHQKCGNKWDMMRDRIVAFVIYDYKIHLSFKNSKKMKSEFIIYDSILHEKSDYLWNEIGNRSNQIKKLRENNYKYFDIYSLRFRGISKIKDLMARLGGHQIKSFYTIIHNQISNP